MNPVSILRDSILLVKRNTDTISLQVKCRDHTLLKLDDYNTFSISNQATHKSVHKDE